MKKFNKAILLIFAVMIYSEANAQSEIRPRDITPLKVGDVCPDFSLIEMVNTNKSDARLSDFRGKVVIFDFWATWCGPCIKAMPALDSLQKTLQDKLVVIPVSYESADVVTRFLARSKFLKNIGLPILTEDTVLRKYFPHRLIPHEVWISPNGIVYAITDPNQINVENVLAAYGNKTVQISQKMDIVDRNDNKPFLVGGLGEEYKISPTKLQYNSLITANIPGLPAMDGGPHIVGSICKMSSTNTTIDGLYQTAFATRLPPIVGPNDPNFYLRMSSRLIWEEMKIKDDYYFNFGKNKQIYKKFPEEERTFCFELLVPIKDSLSINRYAIDDLNRFFGSKFNIEGVKEKRTVTCWVLRRIKGCNPSVSKGGKPDVTVDVENGNLHLVNSTVTEFMFWWMNMALYAYDIPIVDETELKAPIDLDITCNLKDPISVNKALNKHGFQLVTTKRTLDMIIIRSKH